MTSLLNRNGSSYPVDWTYGNYGGRGWTAGSRGGTDFNVPALNALDELFKAHDLAYGNPSEAARAIADLQLTGGILRLFLTNKLTFEDDIYYAFLAYSTFTVYAPLRLSVTPLYIATDSLVSALISFPDPLTLDLDGDGIELTALGTAGQTGASTVFFDFDGDGFRERTGWVKADDGMLAIDLNGNGLIDNGGELFGQPARDGYEVLETYDTFADGVIDAKDAAFARLRIWRDLDQDGITDAGELKTLPESGITSISLTRTDVTGTNQGHASGYDFLGFQGGFTRTKGTAETIHFTTDQRDTRVTCKAALTPRHLSIVLK